MSPLGGPHGPPDLRQLSKARTPREGMASNRVQDHLQSIVTMLALINPVMCGAIFTQLEGARPRHVLLVDATMAALAVLIILVLAALCGTRILDLFGVSLDAFSVAGGGVLSWIGFSMLSGSANAATSAPHEDSGKKASLAPLILFAASP